MAKINVPERERVFTPTSVGRTPGEAIGSAISQVGSQIQRTTDVFEEKARLARVSNEVSTRYTNAIKQYGEWFTQRATQAGAHKTLLKEHAEQTRKIRELAQKGVDDVDVKNQLTNRFNSYFASQELNARSVARRQEIGEIRENIKNEFEKQSELAINSDNKTSQEVVNSFKSNLAVQVEAGVFTKAKAEEINRNFNARVQEGRIVNLMRSNPSAAFNLLKKQKSIPGISPQRHLSLQNMAKSLSKQRAAIDRSEVLNLVKSDLASLRVTGKPVEGVLERARNSLTKKQFAAYEKARRLNIQFHSDSNILKYGDAGSVAKVISQRKPKPGDPQFFEKQQYFKAIVAEHQKVFKQKEDDRAGHYEKHPEITGDPTGNQTEEQRQARVNANPKAHDNKMLALQQKDGVTNSNLSLISKVSAANLIAQYEKSDAKNRIDFFRSLSARYDTPKKYTIAMKDLIKQGLSGEAMLYSSLINNPKAGLVAPFIAQAQQLKMPEIKDGIEPDVVKEIRQAVNSNFEEFRKTAVVSNTMPPVKQLNTIRESLFKVALLRYKKDNSIGTDGAADFAVNNIINENYEYVDTSAGFSFSLIPGGSKTTTRIIARIPRQYSKDAIFNTINEMTDKKKITEFIKNNKVILADYIKQSGMPPAKARDIYVKDIIDNGKWVTKPDESGLYLVDKFNVPVMDESKNRYEFDFDSSDAILKMQEKRKAEQATQDISTFPFRIPSEIPEG